VKKSELLTDLHGVKSNRARWVNKPMVTRKLKRWLIDEGSLTKCLQQRYADFHVKPLSVKHAKVMPDECLAMGVKQNQKAFVREVFLLGAGQPVVFAHSVMPLKHLRGRWVGLARLGKKPLGATLFANHRVKRTNLTYKKLMPNHALYKKTAKQLKAHGLDDKPAYLWARRSIFSLSAMEMMVTEVFLPTLLK
jgi:chorismate--pyruvate lyase